MDTARLLHAASLQRRSWLRHLVTLAGLGLAVIICAVVVRGTGGTAAGYTYLMLIPILLGAACYGLPGGLGLALAGALLFGPSMPLNVMLETMQRPDQWLIRSGVFALVGGVAGTLFGYMRRYARQQLAAARTDPTTGLPNQAALREHLEQLIAARNPTHHVAVILVRATDLAELVDVIGIDGGDQVMRVIGEHLERIGPQLSQAYHYSSSELALVAEISEHRELARLAKTVHERAGASFKVHDAPVRIEPVLGVGHGRDDADIRGAELIRRARVAMRRALLMEHNWVTYEPQFESDQKDALLLISRVRTALYAGEFELHYQPKLRLADRSPAGVEALCRWRQADGTVVLPAAFMHRLEQTSLIEHLTRFVIQQTVDLAKDWPLAPISINFAGRNLADEQLVDELLERLAVTGTAGQLIEVEVTESALMRDPEAAITLLGRLREHGVGISIDDFGTGHSSFAYLQRLPATNLKIDQSFTRRLEGHNTTRRLVQAMIEAGHALGLTVTAEGVENETQAQILTQLGCDLGQGYLWCRARPEAEIRQWLATAGAMLAPAAKSRPVGKAELD